MSRIRWTGLLTASTSKSIPVDSQNELTRQANWHLFISGVLGTSSLATVQLEYSPDTIDTSDANSTWFAPTPLGSLGLGDTFFQARPRKFRVIVSGGDGGTSITVEVRA